MSRTAFLVSLALCALPFARAAAQDGEQVRELRQLLQALETKLDGLDKTGGASSKVTQLGTSRQRGREQRPIVRIYDLSDLFAIAPNYRARITSDLIGESRPLFASEDEAAQGLGGGMMGGGGMGGAFSVHDRPATLRTPKSVVLGQAADSDAGRASMDSLIEAIEATISPENWDVNGGPSTIAALGNALLISADEPTHEQIDALLNLFRKRWGTLRTISVQANWLWLTEPQLAGLMAEGEKAKVGNVRAFGLVDSDAWKKHLTSLYQPESKLRRGYRAAITCYNGQAVNTVYGAQSLVVSHVSAERSIGSEEAGPATTLYSPLVRLVQQGSALQVTPIANISGKTVVLDVHSRMSILRDADKQPAPKAKKGDDNAKKGNANKDDEAAQTVRALLERRQLLIHRLSTTLRVPVGRTMMVGGMTFQSEPQAGDLSLYLFVHINVQELRNDLAAEKPRGADKAAPKKEAAKKPKPAAK